MVACCQAALEAVPDQATSAVLCLLWQPPPHMLLKHSSDGTDQGFLLALTTLMRLLLQPEQLRVRS